jgi:hypothetical protein
MMTISLIGAAAFSLMLATAAMAMRHRYHRHHGYFHKQFGYGSTYGAYAFDRRRNFAPRNIYNDFDRRNTFD